MDPARHLAPHDRAERHVFQVLPGLDATGRRALALAELAGVPRAGVASEIGLGGAELSATLAGARKALRRTRAELGSGGRCERAERALSDRLDGVLSPLEARFLGSHLARCARCRTHETALAAAIDDLRSSFTAAPVPPPPEVRRVRDTPRPVTDTPPPSPAAPTGVRRVRDTPRPATDTPAGPVPPPEVPRARVEPAAKAPRARLRVVPAPLLLPAAPVPPALDAPAAPPALPDAPAPALAPVKPPAPGPSHAARDTPTVDGEDPRQAEPAAVAPPVADIQTRPTPILARHERIRAALPVALAVLIAAGLIAAAIALSSAFGSDSHARAPWDRHGAPVVHPAPLIDQ